LSSTAPRQRRRLTATKESAAVDRGGSHSAAGTLPSTRTLAADLGVARETIEAVYRARGRRFRNATHGSGTYVSVLESEHYCGLTLQYGVKVRSIDLEASCRSGAKISGNARRRRPDGRAALCRCDARREALPHRSLASIDLAHIARAGSQILMYGEAQGHLALRKEKQLTLPRIVRTLHADNHGFCSSSSKRCLWLQRWLADQLDRIAIEDPGYHGAKSAFSAAGLKLEPIPVDARGFRSLPCVIAARISVRFTSPRRINIRWGYR